MIKKLLLSVLSAALCVAAFAQTRPVSGIVTNQEGAPVVGAIVTVQGTTVSSVTDSFGRYTVSAPEGGSLEFTSFGMDTVVEAIGNRSVIDVTMSFTVTSIDDVIVVAYGVARKESFTGSVAVIDSEDLQRRTVSNVTKALDGLVPGLNVLSGGGQPGSTAAFQIRGQGSLNAFSDPLIVVDGAPYSGSMAALNPNDIASVTVLKDASASALYGSRAANGVVMFTTKRGDGSGRVNINFRANVGMVSRSLRPYDTLTQDEYVETTYGALKNMYQYKSGYSASAAHTAALNEMSSVLGGEHYNPYKNKTWQSLIDPLTGKIVPDAVSVWDEDWQKEVTNSSALRQDYSLGLSGGNPRTTFAASAGYLKEDGWLRFTDYERFSASANIDHKIRRWMKMGLSTSYSHALQNQSQYSGTQTGNVWYTAQFMAPIYPVYRKDSAGNDVLDENGRRILDYGDTPGEIRPKGANFNAVGDLADNKQHDTYDIVRYGGTLSFGSDDASAGWARGIKLTSSLNGDATNMMRMQYYNMFHGDAKNSNGEITREHYRYSSYTFNQLLTYNRTFGRHDVGFLAGHEYYNYLYHNLWATRTDLFEGIYELMPGVTVQDGNSFSNRERIEAFFGRVNYGFDNKYYVDAHYRRDGSSRFHADHRWGDFWGAGVSWRISQERFMKRARWVDNLTLKVSYGSLGNNQLASGSSQNYYAWQSFYSLTHPNANNAGAVIVSLANPSVSWETIGTFNTGIEASFFKGRLRLSAEYYIRDTRDMLLAYPMATSTGFNGYNANVGDMTNRGFELTVGGKIFDRRNFSWDATLMGFKNKNKITRLTEATQIVRGNQVWEVGLPLNTFYMPRSAGVDPSNGQQLYWIYDRDPTQNNKIVNERISSDKGKAATSRYYQGSPNADFQGSFVSYFKFFRNFDLSFLTTFSLGGKVYDRVYAATMTPTYVGDTFNRHILRAWKKPGDVTDIPRAEFNAGYTTTDRWLIDASYLTIKNVAVGYTLPTRAARWLDIASLRLYLTFDNIAMFTHLNGMDPSFNFSGGTDYTYAPVRTMSIGLDINF